MSLCKELVMKAKKSVGENPNTRSTDVQSFRMQVATQPGLLCPVTDEYLIRYLRAKKYNKDKAFKLLLNYFKAKRNYPEYFSNLIPSTVKAVFDAGIVSVLPDRDSEGRRIMVYAAGRWDPEQISLQDIDRANFLQREMLAKESETQINGVVTIIDYAGFGWKQMQYFTPLYARRVVPLYENTFPLRPQAMHLVNTCPVFANIMQLIKPLLSSKMQKRIHVHESPKTLHKHVNKDLLPEELGGSMGTYNVLSANWYNQLAENEEEFRSMAQYHFSEVAAVNHQDKSIDKEIAGTAGTFRKLQID